MTFLEKTTYGVSTKYDRHCSVKILRHSWPMALDYGETYIITKSHQQSCTIANIMERKIVNLFFN